RRVAAAEEALRELPLLATVRRGAGPALIPDPGLPPAEQAVAAVAIAWRDLLATGEGARRKRWAAHACAWVCWDVSTNRSRRWCSMRVCGNRTKARRYAATHAAGSD
ncbi:CGNR zinc finger domain-containing protein, partial [Streptomyces sp. BE308]|uniref:CGNR zinc finger domain-containing protein n=1 Tax=Streptomyces sp. BE308 TaxID=3002529 RepID=UPI002E7A34F9